jgi:hypothetical protein
MIPPVAARSLALICALLLAACGAPQRLDAPPEMLANFRLGHVIVVANNATQSPVSRSATPEEWQAALDKAVRERFGRIEGDKYYHFGLHVDGFALAPPGVPVVVSPKSVLIVSATLWDDEKQGKLNERPHQITVFESLSGDTVVGTGLTRTKEEQMEQLAFNAAAAIEKWLLENPEWFPPPPVAPDTLTPALVPAPVAPVAAAPVAAVTTEPLVLPAE